MIINTVVTKSQSCSYFKLGFRPRTTAEQRSLHHFRSFHGEAMKRAFQQVWRKEFEGRTAKPLMGGRFKIDKAEFFPQGLAEQWHSVLQNTVPAANVGSIKWRLGKFMDHIAKNEQLWCLYFTSYIWGNECCTSMPIAEEPEYRLLLYPYPTCVFWFCRKHNSISIFGLNQCSCSYTVFIWDYGTAY